MKIDTSYQTAPLKKGDKVATIKTNFGEMKVKLFSEDAPETVKNFEELARRGFYNGLNFHRVIQDFMIQGGDPRGDGTGGETYMGPGTTLQDEFSRNLSHLRGTLSMANRGPNTGTSQFFVMHGKDGAPWLNGKHTVFGQVVEGFDVLDEIAELETDAGDRPLKKVTMESVTITTQE